MKSNNLRRLEILHPKQVVGIFIVKDLQGDTVNIQNAMEGLNDPAMPRIAARRLIEGKACMWITEL